MVTPTPSLTSPLASLSSHKKIVSLPSAPGIVARLPQPSASQGWQPPPPKPVLRLSVALNSHESGSRSRFFTTRLCLGGALPLAYAFSSSDFSRKNEAPIRSPFIIYFSSTWDDKPSLIPSQIFIPPRCSNISHAPSSCPAPESLLAEGHHGWDPCQERAAPRAASSCSTSPQYSPSRQHFIYCASALSLSLHLGSPCLPTHCADKGNRHLSFSQILIRLC